MTATLQPAHRVTSGESKDATAERFEPAAAKRPRGSGSRWLWITLLVVIVGVGAGYAYTQGQHAGAADESSAGKPAGVKSSLGFLAPAAGKTGAGAAGVDVVPVEVVRRGRTLRVTGSLAPDEQSAVASNTNGIVVEVRVDRGSMVKKGDILVRLDPTDPKNRLAEGTAKAEELKAKLTFAEGSDAFVPEDQPEVKLAKATQKLADSRLRRAEALLPKDAISKDDYDQIKAEAECAAQRCRQALQQTKQLYQAYQTEVAKLPALRKTVADTTILAPFDGMIVEKNVALGEQVTGGFIASKIVTLVRIDPLRVSLTVPQQDIGQIRPGEKVSFVVDTFPDRTFQAEVRYISPVVTNDTRSLVVEAVVSNPDRVLRPGLFVTAEVELAAQQAEMFVPASSVQRLDEVARVFVVRGEVAREQVVALGRTVQDKVEIRSGLTGQEMLVARPERVHDGDAVRSAVKR
jgi:RND family efflux transporter MFP subunit